MFNIKKPVSVLVKNKRTNKYEFDEKKFSRIVSAPEIEDLPIAVVSIVGDRGTGKSFLLNFFLRYLQRYNRLNWLGSGSEPLEGFSWRHEASEDTIGIVIWPEPLVITRHDGTKIVVILMDTQGFFDDQTNHDDYGNLFAISTLVSSIQIYNHSQTIQKKDIIQLSKFIEYAKDIKTISNHKAFQKLLLLVRDRVSSVNFPCGAAGGRDFLKVMQDQDTVSEAWKNLDDCYSEIDCFLVPKPSSAAHLPHFSGKLSQLNPEFVRVLTELVSHLLSPEKIVTKSWLGSEQKAPEIMLLFKSSVENLTRNGCIKVSELLDSFLDAKMVVLAQKTLANFLKIYLELNPQNDKKKVKLCIEKAKSRVKIMFLEETKAVLDQEIVEDTLELIEETIDTCVPLCMNFDDNSRERVEHQMSYGSESSNEFPWYRTFFRSAFSFILRMIPLIVEILLPIFLKHFFSKYDSRSQSRRNNPGRSRRSRTRHK